MEHRIGQPNPTDIAIRQIITLGNEVREMSQAVMANNSYMMNAIQAEIARSERERRKQRKKEIQSFVSVANGHLGLVKIFDDGSKEITDLMLNFVPDFSVCIFEMQGVEELAQYFGICSQIHDFWIIGEIEKVSGKRLWEAFIKNKVRFNSQIPKNKVQNALYEFFMPKIWEAEKRQIPALPGWFGKEFWSAETFLFEENQGFQKLPIRKKSFQDYSETPLCVEGYFEKIRKISDWKHRLWMMLYPIVGMLGSLFWEAGIRLERYLNCVMLAEPRVKRLRSYLAVFNRNRPEGKIMHPDDILQIKDEVLILNSCSDFGESKYKRGQKNRMFQSIADGIVKGEFVTKDGFTINSPVAIFSDRIARNRHAMNIFVDEDFFTERDCGNQERQTEDSVGIVFGHFIKYIENNFNDVKNFLDMAREADSQTAGLCFAFKIFQGFWESHGVDLQMMAGLPENFDFHELLRDNLYFEDDLVPDLVKMVRKEIQKWRVIPKSQGKGTGEEILYSDDFLWIPVKILNDMLSNFGILDQKVQFLERLKAENQMVTDEKGISRKVQVAGKRYEAYQFRRSLFYIPGAVDIVELGKEDTDVEG